MRYFKQEDFNKCREFLKGKPNSVETQQELHNYMVHEHIYPEKMDINIKDMCIYSKIYATRMAPETANWCNTMSNGSQVSWNRKHQEFYWIDEIGMERCSYIDYADVFTEINGIDTWLLENWSNYSFRMAHKQFIAICDGKYNENFRNYWR